MTRVPPYVRSPFPSKENRQISERDDLGPLVVPGGQEIGLGSRNLRSRAKVQGGGPEARPTGRAISRERLGDWDGPIKVKPPCVYPPAKAGHMAMAQRRVGIEYSPSMLEPVRPEAVLPDRALCLPTFSHLLIVNPTSLSLSLCTSHSLSLSLCMCM